MAHSLTTWLRLKRSVSEHTMCFNAEIAFINDFNCFINRLFNFRLLFCVLLLNFITFDNTILRMLMNEKIILKV